MVETENSSALRSPSTALHSSSSAEGYELHISRLFDAPRELVFRAWTDPALLAAWMGPRGFDACDIESDLRVGGQWRLCLAANGEVEKGCDPRGVSRLYQRGTYLEIVPPERLVFTFQWENRNVDQPDRENTITITFRELEGKTVMDFRHAPFATEDDRNGHNLGWASAFDRFAEFLALPLGAEPPKVTTPPVYELHITRTFHAPRELVWKAFTDPAMAMEWMGPRGFKTTAFTTSDKPGDRWQMTMEGKAPTTGEPVCLQQGGVLREVRPPELLSYTFAWEDRSCVGLPASPIAENLVTIRFEEQDGRTVMHFRQTPFATEGERDGHNGGWNSSFDRFAEYISAQLSASKPGASRQATPGEAHERRTVRATRQQVFDAWTKPELLAQWWGPNGFTTPLCELDPRSGGSLFIHLRAPDGTIYPMSGRYLEVLPQQRFHFLSTPLDEAGQPMFELWNSVFLADTAHGVEVVLDCHIRSFTPQAELYVQGMPVGWTQTMDRMAAFLNQSPDTASA